jgi:hypothetical protein
MNAKIGTGAAIHLVKVDGKPACGRRGTVSEPVHEDVSCKSCMKLTADVAPELEPAKAPAPKKAAKPKAKKAAKPKATKPRGETKLFAATKHTEAAASIHGVRWAAIVRATGALTASVNCAEYGLIDAADKWMALCIDHGEQEFHATHRDAWTARRRPQDWCGGCAAIVAGNDA